MGFAFLSFVAMAGKIDSGLALMKTSLERYHPENHSMKGSIVDLHDVVLEIAETFF